MAPDRQRQQGRPAGLRRAAAPGDRPPLRLPPRGGGRPRQLGGAQGAGAKTTWEQTLELARLHRTAFEALQLRAYPQVTGRRGIQVWVPISWDELDLRPDQWTVRTVLDRLSEVGDPFRGVLHHDQHLPRVK